MGSWKANNNHLNDKGPSTWTVNASTTARNLRNDELGGVIFGCIHSTMKECFHKQIFGLPTGHFLYVKKVSPGLPLFLFNYNDRRLHGVFEAVSHGEMNIDPYAWVNEGSDQKTRYGAQVRIKVQEQCYPLNEEDFQPIIAKNYYAERTFWFELDKEQAANLTYRFLSSPTSPIKPWPLIKPRSIMLNECSETTNNRNSPAPYKKWIDFFKTSSSEMNNNENSFEEKVEPLHEELPNDSLAEYTWEEIADMENDPKDINENGVDVSEKKGMVVHAARESVLESEDNWEGDDLKEDELVNSEPLSFTVADTTGHVSENWDNWGMDDIPLSNNNNNSLVSVLEVVHSDSPNYDSSPAEIKLQQQIGGLKVSKFNGGTRSNFPKQQYEQQMGGLNVSKWNGGRRNESLKEQYQRTSRLQKKRLRFMDKMMKGSGYSPSELEPVVAKPSGETMETWDNWEIDDSPSTNGYNSPIVEEVVNIQNPDSDPVVMMSVQEIEELKISESSEGIMTDSLENGVEDASVCGSLQSNYELLTPKLPHLDLPEKKSEPFSNACPTHLESSVEYSWEENVDVNMDSKDKFENEEPLPKYSDNLPALPIIPLSDEGTASEAIVVKASDNSSLVVEEVCIDTKSSELNEQIEIKPLENEVMKISENGKFQLESVVTKATGEGTESWDNWEIVDSPHNLTVSPLTNNNSLVLEEVVQTQNPEYGQVVMKIMHRTEGIKVSTPSEGIKIDSLKNKVSNDELVKPEPLVEENLKHVNPLELPSCLEETTEPPSKTCPPLVEYNVNNGLTYEPKNEVEGTASEDIVVKTSGETITVPTDICSSTENNIPEVKEMHIDTKSSNEFNEQIEIEPLENEVAAVDNWDNWEMDESPPSWTVSPVVEKVYIETPVVIKLVEEIEGLKISESNLLLEAESLDLEGNGSSSSSFVSKAVYAEPSTC